MKRFSSWIDVNLDALEWNYNCISKHVAPSRVIAVVKANGLGGGARAIARKLESLGVYMLAVSHFTEGVYLRKAGIKCPILVMNGLIPEEMEEAIGLDLDFFVFDVESVLTANQIASDSDRRARVHVKVDTGLGRLGFLPEDADAMRQALAGATSLIVVGIGTHMAFPDKPDFDYYSEAQHELFVEVCQQIDPEHKAVWHLLSSLGVTRLDYGHLDAVRCQAILWGMSYWEPVPWPLKPVMSFKTRIVQLKQIPAGRNIGYRHYTTSRPTKLAVLPIGAIDGLTHEHANGGALLVGGRWCPILAVCTCVMMIDVTDVPGVKTGDEVTVIGEQQGEVQKGEDFGKAGKASFMAVWCKVSTRVPRLYWEGGVLKGAETFLDEETF